MAAGAARAAARWPLALPSRGCAALRPAGRDDYCHGHDVDRDVRDHDDYVEHDAHGNDHHVDHDAYHGVHHDKRDHPCVHGVHG
jgi:hypothetical protein